MKNLPKNWVVLAISILVSIVFWMLVTLDRPYTSVIQIPAKVYKPKQIQFTQPPPTYISVMTSGMGVALLRQHFSKQKDTVRLYFSPAQDQDFILTQDYLPRIPVKEGLHILRVLPDSIFIHYTAQTKKKVPLFSRTHISLNKAYLIDYQILTPDSVSIIGPKSILDSITIWYTASEPVLKVDEKPGIYKVPIDTLTTIQVVPSHARLAITPKPYTQKKVTVYFHVTGTPPGLEVRLSHLYVLVSCVIPLEELDSFPDTYSMEIPYSSLDKNNPKFIPNVETALPATARVISRDPFEVSFVIADKKQ